MEGESFTASDLYAPVLKAPEARLILAIAAAEGCSVYKTDTSQAFLYGSMGDDVVYIKAPDWWPEPIPEGYCLQLLKSRQLASLTGQCRQVYCLVEMAPSAPSWRPLHQRGKFDGFPGRREGPNQCRHTRSFQAFSTYPVLRRSHRRRIAPSDPSLNQPSRQSPAACPEWPNSSRTFTNLNNSLNSEPNE